MDFGPKDDSERMVFEEESLICDFELALTEALQGILTDLQDLGDLQAVFAPDNDPTLRDISRLLYSLGVKVEVNTTDEGDGIDLRLRKQH